VKDWITLHFDAILDGPGAVKQALEEHAKQVKENPTTHAALVVFYAEAARKHEETAAGKFDAEALRVLSKLVESEAVVVAKNIIRGMALSVWESVNQQIEPQYGPQGSVASNPDTFAKSRVLHNLATESGASVAGTNLRAGNSVTMASALRVISKNGYLESEEFLALSPEEQLARFMEARTAPRFNNARELLKKYEDGQAGLAREALESKASKHREQEAAKQALVLDCAKHNGPVSTVADLDRLKLTRSQLALELKLKRKQFLTAASQGFFKETRGRKREPIPEEEVVAKFRQFLGEQHDRNRVLRVADMATAFAPAPVLATEQPAWEAWYHC
jgi:hypothetical protein